MTLSAADEWQEAVGAWRTLLAKSPDRPDLLAYLAAVLRRTGQVEEAAKIEKSINLLTMGDGAVQVRIGQGYAYAGDFARAADWWRRAMIENQPGEGSWEAAVELLDDAALMAGDWPLAAALGEARAMSAMDGSSAYDTPIVKLRARFHADMARALARLKTDRKNSLATLEACHAMLPVDGTLADHFLPALRVVGLKAEHDRWFEETWKGLAKSLERFPQCDNTMNTSAWVAARAGMRLDEAEKLLQQALSVKPRQAAYLDTMGEIWFARHNREKALEWSRKAVAAEPGDDQLRRQLDRFTNGPFPP
jgi:tetratricopeptide (TPR) repeat protein